MTARKPKPRKAAPRKASVPTLTDRVHQLEALDKINSQQIEKNCAALIDLQHVINALESRDRLRDKSHDEPVSNAGEAIGQYFQIIAESRAPWWRRFLNFMEAP